MNLDGRRKAKFSKKKDIPHIYPKLGPVPTNSTVGRIIEIFNHEGKTIHSRNRTLLQYLIDHCEEKDIPYIITADPRRGYIIEKDRNTIQKRVEDKLDRWGNYAKL